MDSGIFMEAAAAASVVIRERIRDDIVRRADARGDAGYLCLVAEKTLEKFDKSAGHGPFVYHGTASLSIEARFIRGAHTRHYALAGERRGERNGRQHCGWRPREGGRKKGASLI
jgi:hypothetical protein